MFWLLVRLSPDSLPLSVYQLKYPLLQFLALPHHLNSLRGGQGRPPWAGWCSNTRVLMVSPIPQVLLQPPQPLHWDTRQSRAVSEIQRKENSQSQLKASVNTLVVAARFLVAELLLPPPPLLLLLDVVAEVGVHYLPVQLGLWHRLEVLEYSLLCLVEVFTHVFLLEEIFWRGGCVVTGKTG